MSLKIKKIDYGIAFRIKNTIYLHKDLENYPKLYKNILNHELKHSSGWDLKDFFIDLTNNDLKGLKKEYYKFLLTHPKSLLQFSPVMIINKQLVFDISGLIMIFISFMLILTIIYTWKIA